MAAMAACALPDNKDDRFDAYVLATRCAPTAAGSADYFPTGRRRSPCVRSTLRARKDLVNARIGITN